MKLGECSRIFFWQNIMEPSMTNLKKRFLLFANIQNEFELGREDVNKMFAHKLVLLTLAHMYTCLFGKNPIFPHLIS